jgi:hypothetical protein
MTDLPTEPLAGATVQDLMWLTGQWRGEEKDRCVTFCLVAVAFPDPPGLGSAVFRQEGVADPPWAVYRATNTGLTAYFQRPGEVVQPQDVFHYTRALS